MTKILRMIKIVSHDLMVKDLPLPVPSVVGRNEQKRFGVEGTVVVPTVEERGEDRVGCSFTRRKTVVVTRVKLV